MDQLWLGYDGLSVPYAEVAAVVFYTPALDGRIATSYGRVPEHVSAVVVMSDGAFLPSRWRVELLRRWLARWRSGAAPSPGSF